MSVWNKICASAKDFKEIAWPRIQHWFGDGQLIPVETVTESEMTKLLDQNSGIDAWYIENDKGIRGLASRVQWNTCYYTFTIRKEKYNGIRTEFEKLKYAIEQNWLYPHWFCQSYILKDKGQLMAAAACYTKDLIEYIEKHPHEVEICNNFTDAYFYVVEWVRFAKKYPLIATDIPKLLFGAQPELTADFMRPSGGQPQ